MSRRLSAELVLALILQSPPWAHAASISTSEIAAQTASAAIACMQWMPVGLCFWLTCTPYGCSVDTSIKVGHYNPDFVVSVYNGLGDNPWTEIREVLGSAQSAAADGLFGGLISVPIDSAGNRTEGSADPREHRNLIFRETDAIGHPLSWLSGVAADTRYFCESHTTSFVPYFQSGLDALSWREAFPEILYPASWIPGLREIGNWPQQTWGSVHPRTGWTTQSEEPKAAAVNAQRAGDIVTRSKQPHIYRSLDDPDSDSQRIWPPEPLIENNASTGTWQMLSPRVESDCAVFGTNDLVGTSGWGGGRVDAEGDYVWNLWRPYQCCSRNGQFFLFDINWIAYPP